jgi:hypothetical protein
VDISGAQQSKHEKKTFGYVCCNMPYHVHVTDTVKFITKDMFYTDQDKVAPHIAICSYLYIMQYKPT